MQSNKLINDTKKLLEKLNINDRYINDLMALSFLALLGMDPSRQWKEATNSESLRIHDIIKYINEVFEKNYAENTRETIRKNIIRPLEQKGIVVRNPDDPSRPTNSGKTVYKITNEALEVIKHYGSNSFDSSLKKFIKNSHHIKTKYESARKLRYFTLTINGKEIKLSPGEHNRLQIDILNLFKPKFAKDADILYIGDTEDKYLFVKEDELEALNIPISANTKLQLPDIVLYDKNKNWLFLIEAVTSHGPIDEKRLCDLEKMLINVPSDKIYVTAFPDRPTFRKFAPVIAWETEVWITSDPEHMIHFNGEKFLGPQKEKNE